MEALRIETGLHRLPGIEWSVAARPLPGETVSGDRHVVAPSRAGALLAVIDGLGHGDEATVPSRRASEILSAASDESVVSLVQRCHRDLRETRGAAMTVVSLNRQERTASVLGVGNVEAVLVRAAPGAQPARETALLRNGVVGFQLPVLQASVWPVGPGDLLLFATDGVKEDFGDRVSPLSVLPRLVERILTEKWRGTDDALVLACRILPGDED
ncbi:MAG TPA: SpoIIE family protein phosphatase [Opitutaceae bacterium]|nr:SpoIIE family protein phosphatase [Opitutaceae bacterium]